jgi:nicotinamide riboside kinase
MASTICLLGAESTGKTTLAHAMAGRLLARGRRVEVVEEFLREWCAREGRTPRPEEQLPIAQEQERRVDAAAARADIVIADTSALMVAIYSAMLFKDGSLYRFAVERQRRYDHTLVTGLDLPWIADGLMRDGPHVREPVDALVRSILRESDIPFRVVYGRGPDRLDHALDAIGAGEARAEAGNWAWNCEKCSDPQCEHKLFTRMLDSGR